MEPCIFCDILAKREKGYILYENDYVCAFLDKYPINLGHVLVVPKRHYIEFTDVDEKSMAEVILVAQKLAHALEEIFKPDGITILQNNGIFKDVPHYHLHIFPRYKNDGFAWVEPDIDFAEKEFPILQQEIIEKL